MLFDASAYAIWGMSMDGVAADILCPGDLLSRLPFLCLHTLPLVLLTLARLCEIQSFTESRSVVIVLAIDFRRRNFCKPAVGGSGSACFVVLVLQILRVM